MQPTLMEVLDWQGCMAFQLGRVARAQALFADAHRHSQACVMRDPQLDTLVCHVLVAGV